MLEQDYEEVLRSVHPYPEPPSGFDVRTATALQLARYGFPERPPPESEQPEFDFWEEMFASPVEFVQPQFARSDASQRRVPRPRHRFGHRENSANWSGAYITPIRPGRMLQVAGSWTVPMPAAPDTPPSGVDPANADYRSSTWIGIGGHRSFNTLPQIGTSQRVVLVNRSPRIEFEAWWQWWIKHDQAHHEPIRIANFPVRANDKIFAMLTVEAPWPGDVRFVLVNPGAGRFVAFKVRAPAGILPLGATAEWIHERPAKPGSRIRYPLPDCGDVVFRHCLAWSAPDFGTSMTLQKLDRFARLIRMVETFDAPFRSAHVSVPGRAGNLTIRYCGP